MFQQAMYFLFFIVLTAIVISAFVNLVRVLLSDVQKIKILKGQPRTKGQSRKQRARPIVDIVIYSLNNPDALERSLNSVYKQAYKNFNIIIVDNNSGAQNLLAINKLVSDSKKPVTLFAKTARSSRADAINKTVKKHSRAEWVLIIDAGCTLERNALHAANQELINGSDIKAVLPNISVRHNETLAGLLQQAQMRLDWAAKRSLRFKRLNESYVQALVLRQSAKPGNLLENINTAGLNIAFSENVKINSEPLGYKEHFSFNLSHMNFNNFLMVLQPLVVAYITFVAIRFGAYDYLLLAMLSFVVVLAFNIIPDSSLKLRSKLKEMLTMSPLYVLHIIDNLALLLVRAVWLAKNFFIQLSGKFRQLRTN